MLIIVNLILSILTLYNYLLLAYVIFSWLYNLGLLNNAPRFIYSVIDFIRSLVDPILNKIRQFLPQNNFGLDFAPLVLYLIIYILSYCLYGFIYGYLL